MDVRQYRAIRREIKSLEQAPRGAEPAERKRTSERLTVLRKQLREIETAVDRLPDPDERTVLRLRHIQGMQWEQIAQKMFYSRSTVIRIAGKAEKSIVRQQKNGK